MSEAATGGALKQGVLKNLAKFKVVAESLFYKQRDYDTGVFLLILQDFQKQFFFIEHIGGLLLN